MVEHPGTSGNFITPRPKGTRGGSNYQNGIWAVGEDHPTGIGPFCRGTQLLTNCGLAGRDNQGNTCPAIRLSSLPPVPLIGWTQPEARDQGSPLMDSPYREQSGEWLWKIKQYPVEELTRHKVKVIFTNIKGCAEVGNNEFVIVPNR